METDSLTSSSTFHNEKERTTRVLVSPPPFSAHKNILNSSLCMATPFPTSSSPEVKEKGRSTDMPKAARSPMRGKGSSNMKHRTRFPVDSMRESEKALHKLLEDFEEGKLNAFGKQECKN